MPLQRDGYERAFSKRHQRSYWRVAVPIVEQSLLPLLPWVVAAASATLVVDVGGSTPGGDAEFDSDSESDSDDEDDSQWLLHVTFTATDPIYGAELCSPPACRV